MIIMRGKSTYAFIIVLIEYEVDAKFKGVKENTGIKAGDLVWLISS